MTLDDLEALAKGAKADEMGNAPAFTRAQMAFACASSPDVILDLIRRVREAERAKDGYFAALWLCAEETAFVRTEWDRSKPGWERDINLIYPIAIDQGLPPRLVVQCGDTFAYACADGEDCEYTQAADVLTLMKAEGWPGVVRWCQSVGQRGEPIEPVVKAMATVDSMRADRDAALARVREVEAERDAARDQLRDAADCVDRAEASAERHLDNKRWWMAGMAVVHFFDLARMHALEDASAHEFHRGVKRCAEVLRAAVDTRTGEVTRGVDMASGPDVTYFAEYDASAGVYGPLVRLPGAPPSDGGARQMDEAIARREARIVELEARVEAAESKLARVRDLALSGEHPLWRRHVLAILGGE